MLGGTTLRNWIRLLHENPGIGGKPLYRRRIFNIWWQTVLQTPLRILEELLFRDRIERTPIRRPPIFIVGHWRSGTSHLHRLLAQDPNLGYISAFQVYCPHIFLGSAWFLKPFVRRYVPDKRVMDNMEYSLEYPEEDELALGNTICFTYYHGFSFPQNMKTYFLKSIFEGISVDELGQWKRAYLRLLKKLTYSCHGKRLVLKNPLHAARIDTLLGMFPDAKFIHIHRNPYIVYASTKHWLKKLVIGQQLQDITDEEIAENIAYVYKNLMQAYFNSVDHIPTGNFVEVRFEDLERDALGTVKEIYAKLHLAGFEEAKGYFREYIRSQKGYQKNHYLLDQETLTNISSSWKFTIERWRYTIPEEIQQQ